MNEFWFSKKNIIHNSVHIIIGLGVSILTCLIFDKWAAVWTVSWVGFWIEAEQIRASRFKNIDWPDVIRDFLTYVIPAFIVFLF